MPELNNVLTFTGFAGICREEIVGEEKCFCIAVSLEKVFAVEELCKLVDKTDAAYSADIRPLNNFALVTPCFKVFFHTAKVIGHLLVKVGIGKHNLFGVDGLFGIFFVKTRPAYVI